MVFVPGEVVMKSGPAGRTKEAMNSNELLYVDEAVTKLNFWLRGQFLEKAKPPFEFTITLCDLAEISHRAVPQINNPSVIEEIIHRFDQEGWDVWLSDTNSHGPRLTFKWKVKTFIIRSDNWIANLRVLAWGSSWGTRFQIPSWVSIQEAQLLLREIAPNMHFSVFQEERNVLV